MIGAEWLGVAATVNSAFLFAFSSLFSIINPVGGALIFDGFTRRFDHSDRTRIAAWVGFYSLLIMFGALWTGAYGVLCALLMISAGFAQTSPGGGAAGAPPGRAFPLPLSADLPYDVDAAAVQRLDREGKVLEAQREFDILAWQAFIALNWPADAAGGPAKDKTIADSAADRVWSFWRPAGTIFLPDGGHAEAVGGRRGRGGRDAVVPQQGGVAPRLQQRRSEFPGIFGSLGGPEREMGAL